MRGIAQVGGDASRRIGDGGEEHHLEAVAASEALIAGDEKISLRVSSSRRKKNIHLHTAVPCCRQNAAECLEVDDERTLRAGCETATQWFQAPERPEAEQSVRDLG